MKEEYDILTDRATGRELPDRNSAEMTGSIAKRNKE